MRGHHTWCRNACLNLLSGPRILPWTRTLQSLQALSTLSNPAGAELALNKADQVLDILDPDEFQTQLLREDNRKMKADKGLIGQDIVGVGEGADQGHVAEKSELARRLEEKLRLQTEKEMALSRKLYVEKAEDAGKVTVVTYIPSSTISKAG
jgi:hypothetical protein